jgi:transposase
VLELDPDKLVFLDETLSWLDMPRSYARCVSGDRIYDAAAKKRKGKVSLLAAITNQGMAGRACLIHQGSVDSKAFMAYIEHALCPTLEPGQTVILDNFTVHHNKGVRQLIEARKCRLFYLPTYSPDCNPIENLFAKIKAYIRKLRPDTVHNLITAFEAAVSFVTPTDAANAFRHCGYQ